MRMILFALLSGFLVGCSSSPPAPAGTPVSQTETREVDGLRLAASFSAGGLTVMPILRQDPAQVDQDVTTLAEAQMAGTVEIRELPDSQVNSLLVINNGEKPLLLLAGDLLVGGKQDRIVAKDTLIPPGKAMQVEAFCVEQGRWSGNSGKFEYSGSVVPQSVKNAAARSSQDEVWSKVAEFRANAAPIADFAEGTTVNGAVQAREIQSVIDEALRALESDLAKFPDAVGFVVARGDQIVAVELFGSPKLFHKARSAVLKSYLADATVLPGKAGPIAGADAESALKRALDARKGRGTADMAITQIEAADSAASLPLHGSYGFEGGK